MVEYTTGHFESDNTMAGITIDINYRMADRWIAWRIILRNAMAGIASVAYDVRAGVIGVGIFETLSGMAVAAFMVSVRVSAALKGGRSHTRRHTAIVACRT